AAQQEAAARLDPFDDRLVDAKAAGRDEITDAGFGSLAAAHRRPLGAVRLETHEVAAAVAGDDEGGFRTGRGRGSHRTWLRRRSRCASGRRPNASTSAADSSRTRRPSGGG